MGFFEPEEKEKTSDERLADMERKIDAIYAAVCKDRKSEDRDSMKKGMLIIADPKEE